MANSIEAVSEAFKLCIEIAKNSSPLYELLSSQIVNDAEMLEIASVGQEGQFPPMMLFGAVRYLLLGVAKGHELETFYLDLSDSSHQTRLAQDAYPTFQKFCLEYKDQIQELIRTRLIQTNEVRRCAVMLPAFSIIAGLTDEPLVLIEIGASAGLNLNWDRYRYHFTGKLDLYTGKSDSLLTIDTEIRGEYAAPIPKQLPSILNRTGIDLNPLDTADEDVTRWLHALIWPEHLERWQRLERALSIVQEYPPQLLTEDALEVLPTLLHQVEHEGTLCIFHSTTIYQFSQQMRQKLDDIFTEHSYQRDIYRVSFEWESEHEAGVLRIITYKQGIIVNTMLARADTHGQWMIWHKQSNIN